MMMIMMMTDNDVDDGNDDDDADDDDSDGKDDGRDDDKEWLCVSALKLGLFVHHSYPLQTPFSNTNCLRNVKQFWHQLA